MSQKVCKPHDMCVCGWFRFDFVENDEKYYTKQITKQRIYCIIITLEVFAKLSKKCNINNLKEQHIYAEIFPKLFVTLKV